MPGHDALAIANEFIKLNGGLMNQMKLQKLLYFAQGWNLAINSAPLIADNFEAWDGGPVVRRLWNHVRDLGFNGERGLLAPAGSSEPFEATMSAAERDVVEHAWRKYGAYTGLQLSEMTHLPGTPWANTYFGRGRNFMLSKSDMQQHFKEMAIAGRSSGY